MKSFGLIAVLTAALTAVSTTPAATAASKPAAVAAASGGKGQVWVNTGSKAKTYHCQGSKWYGKVKSGKYMTMADAQAAGYHAAKGEKCP